MHTFANDSQLLCMIDVLGFSDMVKKKTLNQVKEYYLDLVHKAGFSAGFKGGEIIHTKIFSDTILVWPLFTQKIKNKKLYDFLFCLRNVLHNGLLEQKKFIPLRGTLVMGEMILETNLKTNIPNLALDMFLGEPIVDAYRWGNEQQWLGVSIHPEYIAKLKEKYNEDYQKSIDEHLIIEWDVPTKHGLVKTWAINPITQSHANTILENLKHRKGSVDVLVQSKYNSTIKFVEYIINKNLWSVVSRPKT